MRGGAAVAAQTAERIREAIGGRPMAVQIEPDDPQKVMIQMTVSVGVATFTPDITSAEALMARADGALYASKQGGRNRVTLTGMKALQRP